MTRRYRRAHGVVWRRVGNEAILAPPAREDFERLSPTAAATWFVLDETRAPAEVAAELCEVYSAPSSTIEADVAHLLEELHARGLVEVETDG